MKEKSKNSLKNICLYTLGSSNRKEDDFLEILKFYSISCLIDIRRFPTSYFSHFKKDNLKSLLNKQNIDYLYLGDILGGYRKEGYQSYMKTENFKLGIEKIERLAEEKILALMCSERFAWRCHRRFVASSLNQRGIKVIHIIEKGKTWEYHK